MLMKNYLESDGCLAEKICGRVECPVIARINSVRAFLGKICNGRVSFDLKLELMEIYSIIENSNNSLNDALKKLFCRIVDLVCDNTAGFRSISNLKIIENAKELEELMINTSLILPVNLALECEKARKLKANGLMDDEVFVELSSQIYEFNVALHDVNNLLTALIVNIGLIGTLFDSRLDSKSGILEENVDIEAFKKILKSLYLRLANSMDPKFYNFEFVISSLFCQMMPQIEKRNIQVKLENSEIFENLSPSQNLVSAFENILRNAVEELFEASIENPLVVVSLKEVEEFYEIVVSDNGRGMSEEVRGKIFDDFSTKNRGSGQGLAGLPS
jgi:signal transduction histidine kinase